MNKDKFINELRVKLKKLPQSELDNAMSYYIEYFEDAQIDDSVDVEKEFGSPSFVASQILSDYAVKDTESKSKISSIWFIILAIFASPIALPLAFAGVVVIFALLFACVAVLFAFGVSSIAIMFSGVMLFVPAISIIFSEFSTALLFIGVAILVLGLGLLWLILTLLLANISLKAIINIASKLLNKLNKRG